MATFNITLPSNTNICDGKMITFKAPADCTNITGIVIEGTSYTLVNALNENIKDGSFSKDAMISVVLDTTNSKAFLLNETINPVQLVRWEEGE